MTPFELEIVLHYYYTPIPSENEKSLIGPETMQKLCEYGLLQVRNETKAGYGLYETTERAKVYIEHLLATPLPIQQWIVPLRFD